MKAVCSFNDYFYSSCSDEPITIQATPLKDCRIKTSISLPEVYGDPHISFYSCIRRPCTSEERELKTLVNPIKMNSLWEANLNLNRSFNYFEIKASGLNCFEEICRLSFNLTDVASCGLTAQNQTFLNPKEQYNFPVGFIALFVFLALFIIFAFLFVHYKLKWTLASCIASSKSPTFNNEYNKNNLEKETIFIVYGDDHQLHREVVLKFATFLEAEFGSKIFMDLYSKQEIYDNPAKWLERALGADKILVIWSLKTAAQWEEVNKVHDKLDVLSPVMRQIKNDLVLNNDLSKYIFVTFSYCKNASLPFTRNKIRNFELMKQFQAFLDVLLKAEIKKSKQRTYKFDKSRNKSEYKCLLENAVNEMTSFAKTNLLWHEPEMKLSLE